MDESCRYILCIHEEKTLSCRRVYWERALITPTTYECYHKLSTLEQLFFKMNAIVKIVNIRIVNRMFIETLIQCLYFETYMGISCLYVFANKSSQS